MGRGWRNGFGLGRNWVWAASVVSLALVAVAQATNTDGDLRSGLFPWLMAAAAVGLALLGLRLLEVHGRDVTRPVLIGGWWTTLAFSGIAGYFVGVSVLLGVFAVSWVVIGLSPRSANLSAIGEAGR